MIEVPIVIGVALLVALLIKTFLVQAFVIPSGSMEQTIQIGDRVVVNKFSGHFGSEPERGDVVVFKDPGKWLPAEEAGGKDDPVVIKQLKDALTFVGLLPSDRDQDLIKRVVGVGGDRVVCCDKNERITVNGVPIVEPYLHPGNKPSDEPFDVKVPEGRLFVLGDHRKNSADSRFRGTVPVDHVVGKAVAIAWPLGHWSRLEEPGTYASVPDPGSGAHKVSPDKAHGFIPLPTPAELPLVMGVVGLHRLRSRRRQATG